MARRKPVLLASLATIAVLALCAAAFAWWLLARSQDAGFWSDAVAAFEASDREQAPTPGGIVFTGSSSIRFWDTLVRDMAPLPVLNRGFGGSHLAHVTHYLEPLVLTHRPRAVVLYAGDNDLSRRGGKTPTQVAADFDAFVGRVHAALPDARVYFLAIKPSRLRWDRWPEMRAANQAIAARCESDSRLVYLDVATPMLDARGEPRRELFAFDGLHLNETGYALWTEVVAPKLRADWRTVLEDLPR